MPILRTTKIFFTCSMMLGLSGCHNEHLTYSYLVKNPVVLKHEIADCIDDGINKYVDCKVVMSAATTVNKYIDEQQQSPERFGHKILEAQIAYQKSKEILAQNQKSLADLKAGDGSDVNIVMANELVTLAQKIVDQRREEVEIYMAIIGMNSPE